jgi:hypothetical protein
MNKLNKVTDFRTIGAKGNYLMVLMPLGRGGDMLTYKGNGEELIKEIKDTFFWEFFAGRGMSLEGFIKRIEEEGGDEDTAIVIYNLGTQ